MTHSQITLFTIYDDVDNYVTEHMHGVDYVMHVGGTE
jgi:hypothetical protein